MAALEGKSIKQYALERLLPRPSSDDEAWQELTVFLGKRVKDGLAGKVSTKTIGAIVDEELSGIAQD